MVFIRATAEFTFRYIYATHFSICWWLSRLAFHSVSIVFLEILIGIGWNNRRQSMKLLSSVSRESTKINKLKLTIQELIQSIGPVFCVLVVRRLEPHECALNVRLWGHWSEAQSRIRTDQTVVELPFGFILIQCLVKHSQHCGKEASENSIENHVEKEDFCYERVRERERRIID